MKNIRKELISSGIDHLSFSALKALKTNEYMFMKTYIYGEKDYKTTPSLVVGKSCHFGIEFFINNSNNFELKENSIAETIAQAIEYAKNEYINNPLIEVDYGKTGTKEKIIESINDGINNWFSSILPLLQGKKLIGVEQNTTQNILINGQLGELPMKSIIDLLVEDQEGNITIIDWKFKSIITKKEDEQKNNAYYDMQGITYHRCLSSQYLEDKKITCLFFEILTQKPKFNIVLQTELRALCDQNGINWLKGGEGGKYMKNEEMQKKLNSLGKIKLSHIYYQYQVDVDNKTKNEIYDELYNSSIIRLYEILVLSRSIQKNIFDIDFCGKSETYEDIILEKNNINSIEGQSIAIEL